MVVNLISLLKHHIHASINNLDDTPWVFTDFYGHLDTSRREETWNLLQHLQPEVGIPWLVGGDFNEIVQNQDKHGGDLRHGTQMQQFRNVLDCCSLQDFGFEGNIFMWCNG